MFLLTLHLKIVEKLFLQEKAFSLNYKFWINSINF